MIIAPPFPLLPSFLPSFLASSCAQIQPDPDNKMIHVSDTGVGMTRDELVTNLGTIAQSGTRGFIEKMKETADSNLIGQFGVGFYSSFLVADAVSVTTKSALSDKQYIWHSRADDSFSITEDPRGVTMKRGTRISLYLKEDTEEFLQEDRLRDMIKRYSEFINFPIYLYTAKEVEKEIEIEDPDATPDDPKTTTKTVTETEFSWELVNQNKPIWTRNPREVDEEEYNNFYKNISNEKENPTSFVHFKAEGDVDFRSILFIPGSGETSEYDISEKSHRIRLYVRRVFITDEFEDLMPRYLNFITGVVDSDDLPLNVSREILQQSRLLRIIKKKLVRKVLDLLKKLSNEDTKEREEFAKDPEREDSAEARKTKFQRIWRTFGKHLRLGSIEDASNRSRLSKLFRYQTSKSDGQLQSLDEYVARMKPNQKQIYYVTGENVEKMKTSIFVEEMMERGYEVIFMVDAIDEYVMQHLTDYDDFKFMNVQKEGVQFDESDEWKEMYKEKEKDWKDFTNWYLTLLGDKVEKVALSTRKISAPAILLTGQYGLTAAMERIAKSQALADERDMAYYMKSKVLQINYEHPTILRLREMFEADQNDQNAAELALTLYWASSVSSGYPVEEPTRFVRSVYKILEAAPRYQPVDKKPAAEEGQAQEESPAAEEGQAQEDSPAADNASEESSKEEL